MSPEGPRGGVSRGVAGVDEPRFHPLSRPPLLQARKSLSPNGSHSHVLGTLTERHRGVVSCCGMSPAVCRLE